ncbi:dihydrodipicolinate synthase family protein, partial [Pelagibacterium lacus]
TSDRQRKPAGTLTAKAKEEIDYLLARIKHHDPRASI